MTCSPSGGGVSIAIFLLRTSSFVDRTYRLSCSLALNLASEVSSEFLGSVRCVPLAYATQSRNEGVERCSGLESAVQQTRRQSSFVFVAR